MGEKKKNMEKKEKGKNEEEKKRRIPIHGSKRKKRNGKGQVTDRRCV